METTRATTRILAAAAFGLLLVPSAAHAGDGLYTSIGLGYGKLSGSKLITNQIAGSRDLPTMDSTTCCPNGGLAVDFRLGWTIFRSIAPEFTFIGNGWDLGSNLGGAGFIGGGARVFPLGFFDLLLDLGLKDFPLDLSFGAFFGYTTIGKDFAYTGSVVGFDGTIEWVVADFVSLGVRFNFLVPSLAAFAYTDYGGNLGRCLNSSSDQVTPDGMPASESNFGVITKGSTACTGTGPSATFFSPQLAATFHFNLFD